MDNQSVYDACCRNYCNDPIALYQYLNNLFLMQFHHTEHYAYILSVPGDFIVFNISNIYRLVEIMTGNSYDINWYIGLHSVMNFGSMSYVPELMSQQEPRAKHVQPRTQHITIAPILGLTT